MSDISKISGLYYFDDVISDHREKYLLENINKEQWLTELSRRVQHYGYKYNYKKRSIDKSDYLGELPKWTNKVMKDINKKIDDTAIDMKDSMFDQLIVNEYKKGQGISFHVDCKPCFDDIIVCLTIGNEGTMTLKNKEDTYDIILKRKSIIILTGDARYKWQHAIIPSKNHNFTDGKPRISLTFRIVK